MKSWMIATGPLNALFRRSPELARRYFDTPSSFTSGKAPTDFLTTRAASHKSFSAFVKSTPAYTWTLYNPERWEDDYTQTPLLEQQHPSAYMDAFCTVAHRQGRSVILMPARNLVTVMSGDCAKMPSETVDDAYIRTGLARDGAAGDVFVVQAQALQPDPRAYAQFVQRSKMSLPEGHAIWAGLTTMRGDAVSLMVECWSAVEPAVDGFYLNSTPETIKVAEEFLSTIHP